MRIANAIGPARSPAVLEMPSPFSAKVDAHWLTACSLAPAQIIMISRIQNILMPNSSLSRSPLSPSSINLAIGTLANTKALQIGITAHTAANTFQFSIPNTQKKRVEIDERKKILVVFNFFIFRNYRRGITSES